MQRAPLLGPLLGITIPENDLTRSFDAKLRKTSLEGLLADCLRARAAEEFVVIVLEDCHWIGPLARDLLTALVRATAALPVLFVLAYRPAAAPGRRARARAAAAVRRAPARRARAGRGRAARPLQAGAALRRRRGGVAVHSSSSSWRARRATRSTSRSSSTTSTGTGVDPQDEAALRELELPESLHSLILSRVDTLGEAPRRTLKVASVVGRSFLAPALPAVYPELGTPTDVGAHLATLRALDLVALDRDDEQSYIFKHVVTQEVAYESMPFSIRAMLHERVGGYIEETEADTIGLQLDLLAHHYWHSENLEKKREYLVRAGEAAEASYANAAAIDYLERAAPLVAAGRAGRPPAAGSARSWSSSATGRRAEEVEREALAHGRELGDARASAWCETALAEVARKQGRYDEALSLLEQAVGTFESVGDDGGVGQVQHLMGTLAAQQGDYPKAVESYEASLAIRERLDDKAGMAGLLSNLGVVAEYRGDYSASREYHEQALALRRQLDDRRAVGSLDDEPRHDRRAGARLRARRGGASRRRCG